MKLIGENISSIRKANGLSQEALAEMMHISRQAISKWERDEALPDLENLVILAETLKVSTDYLLGIEVEHSMTCPSCASDMVIKEGGFDYGLVVAFFSVLSFVLFVTLGLFFNAWKVSWLFFLIIPLVAIAVEMYSSWENANRDN